MHPPLWSHDRLGGMVVPCQWSSSGTARACRRSCELCPLGGTSSSRSTSFPRSHLTRTLESKRPSTLFAVAKASIRLKCSGASTLSSSVEDRLLAAGDRRPRDVRHVRGRVEPGRGSTTRTARASDSRSACQPRLRRPRAAASEWGTSSQLAGLPTAYLLSPRRRHALRLAHLPSSAAADREVGGSSLFPCRSAGDRRGS